MIKIVKDGIVVKCEKDQWPAMESAGWSKVVNKPDKPDKSPVGDKPDKSKEVGDSEPSADFEDDLLGFSDDSSRRRKR